MYTDAKRGTRTTEFWVLIVINVLLYAQQIAGEIWSDGTMPPWVAFSITTATGIAYMIARGLAKQGSPYNPTAELIDPTDFEDDEAAAVEGNDTPEIGGPSPKAGGGEVPPRA